MDAIHGTRAQYTAGCRCLHCKVANAHYQDWYRQRRRANHVLLGAKIDSETARKLIQQLQRERITKAAIATALGLRSPKLKVHASITVRRLLRLKRVHRQYLSEAHD